MLNFLQANNHFNRLVDLARVRISGHGDRPTFMSWKPQMHPHDSIAQRRRALNHHKERLLCVRRAALEEHTLLSVQNKRQLAMMLRDVNEQLRECSRIPRAKAVLSAMSARVDMVAG